MISWQLIQQSPSLGLMHDEKLLWSQVALSRLASVLALPAWMRRDWWVQEALASVLALPAHLRVWMRDWWVQEGAEVFSGSVWVGWWVQESQAGVAHL